jgi:hypothetical protein
VSGDLSQRIVALFMAKNADGTYRHRRADVEPFIPVLLILGGAKPETLPPPMMERLGRFWDAVGAESTKTTDDLQRAVDAYLDSQPLHPELLFELRQLLRDALAGAGLDRIRALDKTTFQARRPPSEGQTASGPFARFKLTAPKDG